MDGRNSREEQKLGQKKGGDKTEQSGVAAGHMAQAATSLQPKLYECTFCKGEFTSAQALGGHMKVHRREREDLKESSQSTLSAPYDLRGHHPASSSLSTKYDQAPSPSSLDPQSATTPRREKDSSEPGSSKIHMNVHKEKPQPKFTVEEKSEDDEELDLELRLGGKPMKK